ncbi:CinA family nicotinamide mononucleotide deamidase-related protein [Pelagicoccus albus]|uniref:CinA-like protein n=1 Tax=Pelagicoccus albus TaxID=415222 RepID=A0A7X1B892_9BACT|nr:CinA family nicotinamide mononucleotide deamidase-related protein [Pelagicoccus albus]MBC2607209.1 CinA family nicotinamide mononucleotide deamidase-related protein [Pelagicoccus albus]
MSQKSKIILVTLGEELLLGLTPNGHLTYIGDQLRQAGNAMHANITISDSPEDIEDNFDLYWKKADVLITTGGLGPTVDDRTKEVIAQCLGETLVYDPTVMKAIEDRFAALNLVVSENNRKQAFHFENAEVLHNENGTAPGLWLEKDGKILVMLPGPPHELQPMFNEQVLPRFLEKGIVQEKENYIQIRTTGIGESNLETLLQPIAEREDGLELAYCAHPGMVDFRMSFPNLINPYDRLAELAEECKSLLGDNFLTTGNETILDIVSRIMRRKKLKLSTVESCTGGYISNEITNLAGSSEYFVGGMATYSIGSKEDLISVPSDLIQQHDVVSEEVATAMAIGVAERLETDYSISTTGYIGPGGGTERDPVGTVYVGIHTPSKTYAKRFSLRGPRVAQKRRVFNLAVDMLRKELLGL